MNSVKKISRGGQSSSREYYIDCLRILAIIMVLSVHVRGYLNDVPEIIDKILSFGAYGVALYFLISGYLSSNMTSRYMNYGYYVKSRMIRIIPVYYLSLFLTFIFDVFIAKTAPLDWKWIYHVFFVNMFIPSSEFSWWNSVNFFWTMPCFMAWYLVAPLIFRFFNNTKRIAALTLISSCAAPLLKRLMYTFACEQFVNWNFFCLIYDFLLGVLAWYVVKEENNIWGIIYGTLVTVAGILSGNKSGFFVFGILFYFVIIGLNLMKEKINWNNQDNHRINSCIVILSSSTYCVYLFHYFILKIGEAFFRTATWYISLVTFVVIAFMLGYLLWKFVEKPVGDKLKNRLKH